MIFTPTNIKGVYTIDIEKRGDERGFFARAFCKNEFAQQGITDFNIVQINNSFTRDKHTLRGLHYQTPPKAENKLVKCIAGAMFDVVVDLRPKSPTFGQWFGTEISAENKKMVYIPKGCAHGFLTIQDNTEMLYMVGEFYSPENERILRWNDKKFNVELPHEPVTISDKDKNAPDFDEKYHLENMESIDV